MLLTVAPVDKKWARVVIEHSGRAARARAMRGVAMVGTPRTMIGQPA
jgi:hypothetical protein